MLIMTIGQIRAYAQSLRLEEHSAATVQKYVTAVIDFFSFAVLKKIFKENCLDEKVESVRGYIILRSVSDIWQIIQYAKNLCEKIVWF